VNETPEQLRAVLPGDAARLAQANPSWAVVGTAARFTQGILRDRATRMTSAEIRWLIHTRSRVFRQQLEQAQARVAVAGAHLINDGTWVAVMSYSGTLIGIFQKAWQSGKRFSILGTESRPKREGLAMASELAPLGAPTR